MNMDFHHPDAVTAIVMVVVCVEILFLVCTTLWLAHIAVRR